MQLLLHGEQRGIAIHYTDKEGYLQAVVREAEEMLPINDEDPAFVALHREARARAAELGQKSGLPDEVVQQVLAGVNEAGRFADLVAGYIDITPPQRQALLETLSVEERLRRVLVHVQRQIGVLDAQEDIKSQVQEELGERQREMFLREQLKTIQRELGEGDERDDLQELREKLEALDLPAEARKEVDRELGRLSRIGRESMESQVIRTFLENVAELPWSVRSKEHLELAEAQRILDEDHYALGDVKDRVLEFLAVRQLRMQQDAAEPGGRGRRLRRPEGGGGGAGRVYGHAAGHRHRARAEYGRQGQRRRPGARARSCCSSARPASARRRSPRASPARWGGSTSASRSAARATRPTSAATGAPTSEPCRAASSRA